MAHKGDSINSNPIYIDRANKHIFTNYLWFHGLKIVCFGQSWKGVVVYLDDVFSNVLGYRPAINNVIQFILFAVLVIIPNGIDKPYRATPTLLAGRACVNAPRLFK